MAPKHPPGPPMTLAWRRGFFRLWVALALAWVIFIGVQAFRDTSIPSLTKSCSMLRDFVDDRTGQHLGDDDVERCEAVWRQKRIELVAQALVPPLAVLIIGIIFGWIVRGFRLR